MSNELNSRLHRSNARPRALSLPFGLLLLLSLAISAIPAFPPSAASTQTPLNLVTVNIQTSANLPFQYSLTAYNTSGYQVGSYYGSYQKAAFGLPSGTYLVTAIASYQQSYACSPCLPLVSSSGSGETTPIKYVPSSSEYGYAVVTTNSDASVTIKTSNETSAPLVSIPIHVAFANGTAAAGASVYGTEVGSDGVYSSHAVTYGQTGQDGSFTLVVPEAPIQVSAYLSLPIQLPGSVSTETVTVGGEKVNVTLYWEPNSLSLVGEALVLPPQKSADVVLRYQPNSPYPIAYGGTGGTVSSGSTTQSAATATSGNLGQQSGSAATGNRIAPFSAGEAQTVVATNPTSPLLSYALVAVAGLILGITATLLLKRRRLTADNSSRDVNIK